MLSPASGAADTATPRAPAERPGLSYFRRWTTLGPQPDWGGSKWSKVGGCSFIIFLAACAPQDKEKRGYCSHLIAQLEQARVFWREWYDEQEKNK